MPKIKPLAASTINLIAAGEVAERPALIIKELLENSLDAHATQIDIHLEKAGLHKITVIDNGEGMDQADVELAFQSHTTSKLQTIEDLETLQTFGFRGEALASMASVSRLTIQSRPATSPSGYQVIVDNGQLLASQPIGMRVGTQVTVEQLFAQVPARLKFMKKPQTELQRIVEVVSLVALSHPQVSFTLTSDEKNLLTIPAQLEIGQRVAQVLGHQTSEALMPFEHHDTTFTVSGSLGAPQIARKNKTAQFVFINQRPITHLPLNRLVKELYGSLLEPRLEPTFVLFLTLPPHTIDVNIHPHKTTVAFDDEASVLKTVRVALQDVLHDSDLTYAHRPQLNLLRDQPASAYTLPSDRTASAVTHSQLSAVVKAWQLGEKQSEDIVQIHHTYLVTQTPEGLLIIDQHAAHERILYEQFLSAYQHFNPAQASTALPSPVVIALSAHDSHLLSNHVDTLTKVGIQIESFGRKEFIVTHLPTFLKDRDPQALVIEFLDELRAGRPVTGLDQAAHRTIAYLACRNAIKAGDPLTLSQRRELLTKLSTTKNQFTCPHGRPVTVTFTLKDLEVLFKRR